MAMRAMMKKFSPKIRLREGIRIPRCFNSALKERDLNNEAVEDYDLKELLNDWWKARNRMSYKWFEECNHGQMDAIDRRWDRWVNSSHELWVEKNEEEQRRDIEVRWKYLKDLLNRRGIETRHHRLLLSMIENERGILEFRIGSPDKGLVSVNRLELDTGYTLHMLPRQTVSGLLCIIRNRQPTDAFIIYNPMTGELSPWIEVNMNSMKHSHIAFGYNPQRHEHIVICITGNNSFSDQVFEIFTVGKNTWRRIDAVPPIPISFEVDLQDSHEDPFYVDGCLYWRFRQEYQKGELELIMRFDIVNEKFRVIPVPDFVIDPLKLKRAQTVELTEIDGCIAVLDPYRTVWKIHEEADGNITWDKEVIEFMPIHWNGDPELSFEALTGTNLIFIQSEWSDSFVYYNRDTKEAIRFPIFPESNSIDWKRIIQV